MPITFTHAPYASDLYAQSLILREKILRRPLGMQLRPEDVEGDETKQHWIALENDTCIATVSITMLSPTHAKLRQMAVDEAYAGQGIGAALVRHAHTELAKQGIESITLNARGTAIGFYEKLGYTPCGEPFEQFSIPHQMMEITLAAAR